MKIATFNINNVHRRLPVLLAWLKRAKPDIVCLQELKAAHEAFPAASIEDAGLKDKSTVLIATDHGFKKVTKIVYPNVVLRKAGMIQVGK